MDYVLTEHARDAVEKRRIQLEWVERAMKAPERVEPDRVDTALEHRLARIAEFDNRVLRVVVNRNVAPARIITVFFDRRRTLP
ncbi:MAG TPA: hypothetical protein DHV08_04120 [Rhodocyclaceae bacterium]|nr:hypothetical protein [Rhodocyclaceae bacterium]